LISSPFTPILYIGAHIRVVDSDFMECRVWRCRENHRVKEGVRRGGGGRGWGVLGSMEDAAPLDPPVRYSPAPLRGLRAGGETWRRG